MEITDQIIKSIEDELLISARGIMTNAGLGNSNLIKRVGWEFEVDKFVFYTYDIPKAGDKDYFFFVDQGRKRFANKVPVQALLKWMDRKGIQPRAGLTKNQVAYAIQNGIFKSGIRPRRFIDMIVEASMDIILEGIVEDYTISVTNEISKELEKISIKVKV